MKMGRGRVAVLAAAMAIGCLAAPADVQASSAEVRDEGHGWFSGTNVSAFVDVASVADTQHGNAYWEFSVTYRCNNGVWESFGANSVYYFGSDASASAGESAGSLDVRGWGRFCGDVVTQPFHFRSDMTGTTSCGSSDSGPTLNTTPISLDYAKYRCNTGPGSGLFDFYSANAGGWHYNNYTGSSRLEYWNGVNASV